MRFEKWQALGNDYLIVEHDELPFELTPPRVRRLCEAHVGVHADGVLLLARSRDADHVAELQIFNPDGSQAELSGNGAREATLYLRLHGWTEADEFSILTAAGEIRPEITGPFSARVDMGVAHLASKDYPAGARDGIGTLEATAAGDAGGGPPVHFRHVSIGNPQCAISVGSASEVDALDLARVGPPIEAHAEFPNRTNVSWYSELERAPHSRVRARIFERGVGETASSGTGASGAAIAYLLDRAGEDPSAVWAQGPVRVTVVLDGGELDVEVDEGLRVHLSGWAVPVFSGSLSEEFVRSLAALQ
jgi:diaminopimelate epimerase